MPARTPPARTTAAAKPSPRQKPSRKPPVKRRDGVGRIDPQYARELLAKARETQSDADDPDNAHAFLKNARTTEPLAEELGESFVETVTSGEDGERRDRFTDEEVGGPFVVTEAGEEFAAGTDESNIAEALREPLPRTSKAEP